PAARVVEREEDRRSPDRSRRVVRALARVDVRPRRRGRSLRIEGARILDDHALEGKTEDDRVVAGEVAVEVDPGTFEKRRRLVGKQRLDTTLHAPGGAACRLARAAECISNFS